MHVIYKKYFCRCGWDWLKFIQVNPSDASMVSVTKNGEEVSNFFNNKYCGSGSWSKALRVNSEYEIRGAESIKIEFRSDNIINRPGFLIEYTMVLNEISTIEQLDGLLFTDEYLTSNDD